MWLIRRAAFVYSISDEKNCSIICDKSSIYHVFQTHDQINGGLGDKAKLMKLRFLINIFACHQIGVMKSDEFSCVLR